MHARHRCDLTADFLAHAGKQRKYEVCCVKLRLAHERTQIFSSSQATWTLKNI
jgi:hypothetical protein